MLSAMDSSAATCSLTVLVVVVGAVGVSAAAGAAPAATDFAAASLVSDDATTWGSSVGGVTGVAKGTGAVGV
jgi:hypothetical protein